MTLSVRFDAILFDFDGVLLESEYEGNRQVADYLTQAGHPTTTQQAMDNFMGLSGEAFLDAISGWIGRSVPESFHVARETENQRVLKDGIVPVAGAVKFVRALPDDLSRAIASSSGTPWLTTHLDHLGVRDAFEGRIFSGKEHVSRGKPSPDIYLYAAAQLGVSIERCVILEDSPVGVTGALESGAQVIGLCAGRHCGPNHATRLREMGVELIAHSFDDVARLIA